MSVSVKKIAITSSLFWMLLRESYRGKGTGRTLMNYLLSQQRFAGNLLDLGSKSNHMSYNRFLHRTSDSTITYTDMTADEDRGVKGVNLEEPFDLPSDTYDAVFCFNTLEHIYNYRNVMSEIQRILKPDGQLILSVPFLTRFHQDPHDYFRYTYETLERIATEAGLIEVRITALCIGPFTSAFSLWYGWLPRYVRPFFLFPNLILDLFLARIRPNFITPYAEGYFLQAKKHI